MISSIGQLDPMLAATTTPRATALRQGEPAMRGMPGFADVLSSRLETPADDLAKARSSAAEFVAMAFIQPLVASIHDHPFAAGPFAPNEGEKRFSPLLDAAMSDRIASATSFALTDAVASRLRGVRHA